MHCLEIRRCEIALALCALVACILPARAEQTLNLTMQFPDMAPFLVAGDAPGVALGPIADRITLLAAKAGIRVDWVGPVPRNRILAEMQAGQPICYPNIRWSAERATQFKFTEPLFPPPRWMVLARQHLQVRRYSDFAALLADPEPTLGRLLGTSLGPELDDMISNASVRVVTVRGSPSDLLVLLAAGRIDYLIVDAIAIRAAASEVGIDLGRFDLVDFPDLPHPEAGRIMCAPSVSDDVIVRFNQAISDNPVPPGS